MATTLPQFMLALRSEFPISLFLKYVCLITVLYRQACDKIAPTMPIFRIGVDGSEYAPLFMLSFNFFFYLKHSEVVVVAAAAADSVVFVFTTTLFLLFPSIIAVYFPLHLLEVSPDARTEKIHQTPR